MPEHILRCHPFVGNSFLSVNRYDDEEQEVHDMIEDTDDEAYREDNTADRCSTDGSEIPSRGSQANLETSEHIEIGTANAAQSTISLSVQADRRRNFIIDDSADAGPACFFAVKSVRAATGQQSSRSKVTAVAVREQGSKKFSKVLGFVYTVPSSMAASIETWVAVPRTARISHLLFSKRDDEGNMVIPQLNSSNEKDIVERELLQSCVILTIGQRCADWFLMRHFRVTGNSAGKILLENNAFRGRIGLAVDRQSEISTPAETLKLFIGTWFSSKRSTEQMMRGTANEGAVIAALSSKPFIKAVFECGMLAKKDCQWLACSPDGIALIDTADLEFGVPLEPSVKMASVEIKTIVAQFQFGQINWKCYCRYHILSCGRQKVS